MSEIRTDYKGTEDMDSDDVAGHGAGGQDNETVLEGDTAGHGMPNDNETVLDDDVAGHAAYNNDNETVIDG